MVPPDNLEMGTAQPVRAEKMRAIRSQHLVGVRGASPRPARRVQLLDNRLHVQRRPVGRNDSPRCSDSDNVQRWVIQSQAQRNGIINAGINVENDFSDHSGERYRLGGQKA